MATSRVVIKHRDLDTDEHEYTYREIDRVPDNLLRQEQLLVEEVTALHPEARHRTFAEGVASFVTRRHLIVASFEGEATAGKHAESSRSEPPADQQLFAA